MEPHPLLIAIVVGLLQGRTTFCSCWPHYFYSYEVRSPM